MIEDSRQYFPLLLNRLQQLDLFRVILFGSYASGRPAAGSDIDLLVILDRDDYPETYREKSDLYLQVAKIIRDIRQQIPIDLIVQTRAMYEKFVEMDSLFAREIQEKGKVLYEADN
ncbi:MAG TPA: nucleotidyltransferase domain-containing protein [Chromatiaceae bacterium]|nr:nucleotidyltransferase domain-containing protein [Chromatiaceae bacterium]HIP71493.1 nucleotidyltransferase domain-containing protein [Anaerolineae bacterium]